MFWINNICWFVLEHSKIFNKIKNNGLGMHETWHVWHFNMSVFIWYLHVWVVEGFVQHILVIHYTNYSFLACFFIVLNMKSIWSLQTVHVLNCNCTYLENVKIVDLLNAEIVLKSKYRIVSIYRCGLMWLNYTSFSCLVSWLFLSKTMVGCSLLRISGPFCKHSEFELTGFLLVICFESA